ncbi:MAG TPA: AI-2E family transporter [Bryobacteraceae bacterium]
MTEAAFTRRVLIAIGILVMAAAAFLISFEAIPVLLLLFLSVLLAIFIRALAHFVGRYTDWRFRWNMLTVVAGIAGLLTLGALLLGPNAVAQVSGVMAQLPEVRRRLDQYGWSGLLYHIPGMQDLLNGHLNIWNRMTQSFSFSATFGPVISIGLVIIIGIYLAASPEPYLSGFVLPWPAKRREAVRAVLLDMADTLRRWLLGQAAGMLFIGIVVGIGLHIMRMPVATSLGIFAGLMAFVPNIGYFVSIAPAILLAVLQSPLTPLYVVILYTAAHWSNDYVLMPLMQKRNVQLPPALNISTQLVLGYLLGGLGLLIAAPLVAVLLVLGKSLEVLRLPYPGEAGSSPTSDVTY